LDTRAWAADPAQTGSALGKPPDPSVTDLYYARLPKRLVLKVDGKLKEIQATK
jgi:hypothetical protein